MNLTEHFTLEELYLSSTAARLGIDNTPSAPIAANLQILAGSLEHVRTLLGQPMHIDSAYRCPALNAAVKGAATSAHLSGFAADFICPQFGDPETIVRTIAESVIEFDQCIYEGTWVHISFDPQSRRELLTAHFGPAGTTYTRNA